MTFPAAKSRKTPRIGRVGTWREGALLRYGASYVTWNSGTASVAQHIPSAAFGWFVQQAFIM